MYSIPRVWAWGGLLITQVYMKSMCQWEIYNTRQKKSTVWIPGNRSEHFLSRWDLILLGDFFCFRNTGRQLRQTIPNKPQRKSDVFIQLCLMTVLLLPAWLSSSHTVPKMELEILLWNVTADLWIIVFLLSFCIQAEECWSHKLHEFMTFLEAYRTTSAWTGPDGTLPVDQCAATLHSPTQIGVCVCCVEGGYGGRVCMYCICTLQALKSHIQLWVNW